MKKKILFCTAVLAILAIIFLGCANSAEEDGDSNSSYTPQKMLSSLKSVDDVKTEIAKKIAEEIPSASIRAALTSEAVSKAVENAFADYRTGLVMDILKYESAPGGCLANLEYGKRTEIEKNSKDFLPSTIAALEKGTFLIKSLAALRCTMRR